MKKSQKIEKCGLIISLVAILVLGFATGIMWYGMNTTQSHFQKGFYMFFIGLLIMLVGIVTALLGMKEE